MGYLMDRAKIWWLYTLGIALVLIISEGLYIVINKPPEYAREFLKVSMNQAERNVDNGRIDKAWKWIRWASRFQVDLNRENEVMEKLALEFSLPVWQKPPLWMEENLGGIWNLAAENRGKPQMTQRLAFVFMNLG